MSHLQLLLHDKQCTNGGVAFQTKLHLQQTFPLLSPEPYKHSKTIKLNPNTPWMNFFYTKKKTFIINVSYPPWIIINSWKSNTSINCSIRFALLDFWSQFLTSHAIFRRHTYTPRVDQKISCKFSSFSICDVASWVTLLTP